METRTNGARRKAERVLLATRFSGNAKAHHDSLEELERLTWTAGGVVVGHVMQERVGYDPATFLGAGKVADLSQRIKRENIELVIFDQELSATQNRNLEQALHVRVLDRTGLILDIFARHATTREGKLQVELAQLNYLLPRIIGQVSHWSRQAGGIGTLGPGETLLEMERRRLRDRIALLKRKLSKVQVHRDLQRKRRQQVPVPMVSLVGYTNAGKSSLMNRVTAAGVLVEDTLFATLDPTVRRVRLPNGRQVLLADTVGFVRNLPHQLIEAFKATLREIGGASLLLHIIDTPQSGVEEQVQTVDTVLAELGFQEKPIIRVFNKMDCKPIIPACLKQNVPWVAISATTGEGVDDLLTLIDNSLAEHARRVTLILPYREAGCLDELYRACRVLNTKEEGEGLRVTVEMEPKFISKYASYIESH